MIIETEIRDSFQDGTLLLALKVEDGVMSREMQVTSKTGEGKEVHSLLEKAMQP